MPAPVPAPSAPPGHALQALYTEIMLEFRNDAVLVVGEPHLAQGVECGSDIPRRSRPARGGWTPASRRHSGRSERENPPVTALSCSSSRYGLRQLHVPLPQGFEWIHGSSLGAGRGYIPSPLIP